MAVNIQQIIQVTSESLQKKIRSLLPSQQGFGVDLQASNVIVPIVDLTAAAEGATVPSDLQQAWDFTTGQNTVSNGTSTIINGTGFWKVSMTLMGWNGFASTTGNATINITDGLSTKVIWEHNVPSVGGNFTGGAFNSDFVVFLRSGDSLTAQTNINNLTMDIWYRQIADVNGNLVNPSGFTPQ